MGLKLFVQEGLNKGEITAIVNLNVDGAFEYAWTPSLLKKLEESGCPRNLLKLKKITSAKAEQPCKQHQTGESSE